MNKQELINDITVGIAGVLGMDSIELVKAVLTVKLQNYDLVQVKQLPSTEVIDNDEVLKRFVVDMTAKGLKASTVKTYIHSITKFFDDMNTTYNQVTGEMITNYIAMLRIQPNVKGVLNSPNSVRNTYICLKQFFDWAYKKHKIETDIMRDVDVVNAPVRKKERLSDEEVERIRDNLENDKERALFELMISTGLRVGEISNLLISDIDFHERSIRVREGKTVNAERTVYMSIKARNAIVKYLGDKSSGYLFASTKGKHAGTKTTNRTIEVLAIRMGERVGCHIKTTVHVYRKTFASVTFEKTNDMKLVSQLLGHSSTDITEKCYVVENKEDIKHRALKIS